MKIKCEYCGTFIDDTNANCPNCGSPCSGVKRAASKQPMTIEELQQWYKDRGLPPYETTRFFIGEDYKGPRAFGIFKEESTGNFVVYKNKDSGERAVRYRGTDEAYAVNELLQRLKQEILQQKNQVMKKNAAKRINPMPNRSSTSRGTYIPPKKNTRPRGGCLPSLKKFGIFLLVIVAFGFIAVLLEDEPTEGYYEYNRTYYYYLNYYENSVDVDGWFEYDARNGDWLERIPDDQVPEQLVKDKTADEFFIQTEWDDSLDCSDFTESVSYFDAISNFEVSRGYYNYNDTYYYHLQDDRNAGWYYYDNQLSDWVSADYNDVPEDLTHSTTSGDFYDLDTWDSSTQVSDFSDTEYYKDYYDYDSGSSSSWYDDDDDDYNWGSSWDDDDDDDWWSSSDSDYDWSWDSGGSDWDSDWRK